MLVTIERLKRTTQRRPMLYGQLKKAAEKKLFFLMNNRNPSVKDIEKLIDDGVDINCRIRGRTPLLQFTIDSDSKINVQEIVRLFFVNGVDINATDANGSNALHYLCCHYNGSNLIGIVRLFADNGADTSVKDNGGKCARDYLFSYYQGTNKNEILKLMDQ